MTNINGTESKKPSSENESKLNNVKQTVAIDVNDPLTRYLVRKAARPPKTGMLTNTGSGHSTAATHSAAGIRIDKIQTTDRKAVQEKDQSPRVDLAYSGNIKLPRPQ